MEGHPSPDQAGRPGHLLYSRICTEANSIFPHTIHTRIAEDIEAKIEAAAGPLILGRGKHMKTALRWYTSAWEHH